MLNSDQIKTREELEFAIFCIENLALAMHIDAPRIYQMLNYKSDILKNYIVPLYDILHTQDKNYIINDIMGIMKEEGLIS